MRYTKKFHIKGLLFCFGLFLALFVILLTPFRIQAAEASKENSASQTPDETATDTQDTKNTKDTEDTEDIKDTEVTKDSEATKDANTTTDPDTTKTDPAETDTSDQKEPVTDKKDTTKEPATDTSSDKTDSASDKDKEKPDETSKKTPKCEWVTKKQNTYYTIDGKKQKGIQKIKGKTYFFDSKGVQRTGWQKLGDDYYFFRIANGKKGYMETSQEINGITLKKSGKAKLTKTSLAKLDVLIKANKIVESVTKPAMSKSEKLKLCYQYAKEHFQYRGSPTFHKTAHWELTYALDMFDKGHGSCYSYGAALAFLANAVGYKDCYAISSGGHGWTEINGKVYDISWDLVDKNHSYYALNYNLSGVAGRPNYRKARNYAVKI